MTWHPVYSNGRFLFEFDPILFRVRIKRNREFYVTNLSELLLQTMAIPDNPPARPCDVTDIHPNLHLDD